MKKKTIIGHSLGCQKHERCQFLSKQTIKDTKSNDENDFKLTFCCLEVVFESNEQKISPNITSPCGKKQIGQPKLQKLRKRRSRRPSVSAQLLILICCMSTLSVIYIQSLPSIRSSKTLHLSSAQTVTNIAFDPNLEQLHESRKSKAADPPVQITIDDATTQGPIAEINYESIFAPFVPKDSSAILERMGSISKWSEKQLSMSKTNLKNTVLLPYGLDIISACGMYPKATKFVILTSNESGRVSDLLSRCAKDCSFLSSTIHETQKSLQEVYSVDGSILNNVKAKGWGTFPILVAGIYAMGGGVTHISTVSMGQYGDEIGFEMEFLLKGKKLNLLHIGHINKLGDAKFRSLTKQIGQMGPFNTMIHASNNQLSSKRKGITKMFHSFVLKHSFAIVQDDTGFPYSLLSNEKSTFHTSLYGNYIGPIVTTDQGSSRSVRSQESLKNAYRKQERIALPFHFGKKYATDGNNEKKIPSWDGDNIMVCIRDNGKL